MNIPAAYTATLAHVRAMFPDTIIAGGSLRDLDNGRPVKDVDLFSPNMSTNAGFEGLKLRVAAMAEELGGGVSHVMGGYENWATDECMGVFDIHTPELDFQLICLSSGPETILPRIDFGLCRIGYDGNEVHRTDEYNADKNNERFTLHRCENAAQFDRSMDRYQRLSQKYPGWSLDISDALRADGFRTPEKLFGLFD